MVIALIFGLDSDIARGYVKIRNLVKQQNYLNVLDFSTAWLTGFCEFASNQINQKNLLFFIFDTPSCRFHLLSLFDEMHPPEPQRAESVKQNQQVRKE